MSYGEYCVRCRHYPQSHEENGCRAGWDKDSKYQPKLAEGEYHCPCNLKEYDSGGTAEPLKIMPWGT